MWLKIDYKSTNEEYTIFNPNQIKVSLEYQDLIPLYKEDKSIRVSKIFPLFQNFKKINIEDCQIRFLDFDNPFRILGKISEESSDKLKQSTFFTNGLCSIVIISSNIEVMDEFDRTFHEESCSMETWEIKNSLIQNANYSVRDKIHVDTVEILDYSALLENERIIVDEFYISFKILIKKIECHGVHDGISLAELMKEVQELVSQLIYLNTLEGEKPAGLYQGDKEWLKNPIENRLLKQQNLDRLIQINSTLSYVTTQSFSGAIPILERRSLIRRNSLLGVGGAIKTLNRIVEYIEDAFNLLDFESSIIKTMSGASPLEGLEKFPLVLNQNWYRGNIENHIFPETDTKVKRRKMAHFSARLGYRESEYAITAALNSLTSGMSLEWSLLTISHEILHSHVRTILTSLFYKDDDESKGTEYTEYYNTYYLSVSKDLERPLTLAESIRNIVYKYSSNSKYLGSLTNRKKYKAKYSIQGVPLEKLPKDEFQDLFQDEYRNLNEIFVHVLDLHYFYGGRITKYIPLIWTSWSSVPHVKADIRQYILRSLLTISSKINQNVYERFNLSVSTFIEILEDNTIHYSKFPLLKDVFEILSNKEMMQNIYFPAFKNSVDIVDLVMNVFFSKKIKAKLYSDDNISYYTNEGDVEQKFSYNAPESFSAIEIACPLPYLFDKMSKVLKGKYEFEDLERETALVLMAMNSKNQ